MKRLLSVTAALVLGACGSVASTTTAPLPNEPDPSAPPPEATAPSPVVTAPDGSSGGGTAEGPPAVAYVGRFDTRDPAGPKCGWPGCRVVVRFVGTEATVRLVDELGAGEPGPSQWDVSVDGAEPTTLVTSTTPQEYPIAGELALGVHTVELYKRSEAQVGVTQILGFRFGAGQLLAPPPARSRRLEIVGDSSATGFGVAGRAPCPPLDWAARWEDFHVSFGARLGELLDAEVHGTAYSGKGLVKNIWRPDTELMPLLFTRANPNDPTSTFDLASWIPDVVVVMIGGNDFDVGLPEDDGPATLEAFTKAYADFVAQMRAVYTTAWIVPLVSPSLHDDVPAGRNSHTNVATAIASVIALGDPRIFTVPLTPGTDAELVGCDGHGSPDYHERIARELEGAVRQKVGWK